MKKEKKMLFVMLGALALCLSAGGIAQVQNPDFPNYSKSARSEVPETFRWRLEELFKSPAEWRTALAAAEAELKAFTTRLDGWRETSAFLADCLEQQEPLQKMSGRLTAYASLSSQVAWSDQNAQDMNSQSQRFFADLSIQISRLAGRIGGMKALESQIASESRLGPFAVYLRELVRSQSHDLPPALEELLVRMDSFSRGPRTSADCLRQLDMPPAEATLPDGQKVTMTGANWWKYMESPVAAERAAAYLSGCRNRARFENTFASLLDTSVKQDWFRAQARQYPDSLSAELFPYDVPTSVYRNLIETVRNNLGPYHRYLNLRKKILGLSEYHLYDNFLPLVSDRSLRYSFEAARSALESATRVLGPEYSALVKQATDDHWIDAYGHRDKMNQGSAQYFAGVHPYVNLDYRGSFFDLITVAHELGHAFSFHIPEQAQPFSCSQINWFVSEVPSTFNEILVTRQLIRDARDDRQKLALYGELISRLCFLLFDGVRGAELQLAIHEQVEKGGALSPAWLNDKQLELTRHYLGAAQGVVVVDEEVRSNWNTHTVFFAPFQDYYYVVGSLVSLVMIERIDREGEPAARAYMDFLKAGSSRPIMEVLREMGVDLETSQPIQHALKVIDTLVSEMEELAGRIGVLP